MKRLLLFLFVMSAVTEAETQVKWTDSQLKVSDMDWNNYSTSYIGDDTKKKPVLVTAIPYNGIYNVYDRTSLDMDFPGSAFRFRSNLDDRYRKLFTSSHDDVYFLVPGIFRSNANEYEFRVTINDSITLIPWADIVFFVDNDFTLNSFPKGFAFLGGFHADWGQYLVVELRKKGSDQLTAASDVYWKRLTPQLINVFTSAELNDLLLKAKRPFDINGLAATPERWKGRYKPEELDSTNFLPKKLRLNPHENNLTFVLDADIYKKEALSYGLYKDGHIYRKFGFNDQTNNLISLRDLPPGKYSLVMAYTAHGSKMSTYSFEIRQAWYQIFIVKAIGLIFLAGFSLSFFLWRKLKRQQRKMAAEQAKRQQLQLGLKTIHSQLNPHFIFNALSSIQGLINNQNIQAANHYLSDFGTLVRSALTDSNREFIPLSKEISTLDTYLKLEQLRFNFDFRFYLDERIETATTELPSLLLQPLVENAVKHGISEMNEQGQIGIRFTRDGEDLLVVIQDNGAGFDALQPVSGLGLKLTKDRILLLNEMMTERRIDLIIKSKLQEGTTITLLFKNWLT